MQAIDVIFQVAILIFSAVVHEVAHGYAASLLGDQTARYEGRLTLNPIKHLDPMGSVVLPLMMAVVSSGKFIFGWAKPVPFNPYNLRNRRTGELLIAAAGPASNILLAVIFAFLVRLVLAYEFLPASFVYIGSMIVYINLLLAVFNLMPIPPLDGSKIFFNFLPLHLQHIREVMERYALLFVFIFIFFIWQFIAPVISWLFLLLIGPVGI